ncbi:MAG: hypothetical protein FWE36_08135 [Erysipelotrichales bacterium]|nr:hypothetical protein [Erysipelotrichales bacterium]
MTINAKLEKTWYLSKEAKGTRALEESVSEIVEELYPDSNNYQTDPAAGITDLLDALIYYLLETKISKEAFTIKTIYAHLNDGLISILDARPDDTMSWAIFSLLKAEKGDSWKESILGYIHGASVALKQLI